MDRVKSSEAVADASIIEDGYVRCSECGRLGQHEDDCKKLTQGKAAEKMNPVTIPELRSLLSKATPGPLKIVADQMSEWHRSPFNPWRRIHVGTPKPEGSGPSVITGHFVSEFKEGRGEHETALANAQLHAAAVNALPALLDVAEAALKARSHDETFTGCISDPRCNVCSRCRVEVALAKLNGAMGTDVHGDTNE